MPEGVDINHVGRIGNNRDIVLPITHLRVIALVSHALAHLSVSDKLTPRKGGFEAFAERLDGPLLAKFPAQRCRARDMVADLSENAAPFLQLRAEGLAVQCNGQGAVGNPRSDEFDSLFCLRHAIGHIEFKERFGIRRSRTSSADPLIYAHARTTVPFRVGDIKSRFQHSVAGSRKTAIRYRATELRSLSGGNYFVVRAHVAKNITGGFFDDVGVRDFRGEQRHIVAELRAHGFEAFDLEVEKGRTFEKLAANLKTVAARSEYDRRSTPSGSRRPASRRAVAAAARLDFVGRVGSRNARASIPASETKPACRAA